MTIEISAFDTLFFRDGKPFSMGNDVWASGIFPPYPSVFYGMIRTAYAAQKGIPVEKIITETNVLKIKSIYLKTGQDFLFPYPADVISINKKEDKASLLSLTKNEIIGKVDIPYVLKNKTDQKVKDFIGGTFINELEFNNYLNGAKDIYFIKKEDIIITEPKVGIAKELSTNQTDEGKLYRVGQVRPANNKNELKFVIEFDGVSLNKEGFLKIGAENKTAFYNSTAGFLTELQTISNGCLKLYLATPGIFNEGALPEFIKNREYQGIKFELLTYATGKPIFIGGFDMKTRKPKPMQKAVPAGSVYYLKTEKANELAKLLHGINISEKNPEQGFGLCYCGTFSL